MALLGGIGGKLYRGEVSVEFVARKRLWYSISGVILAVSVIAVLVFGLNFSVDFKGGSVYQFPAGSATITQVRQTVSGAGGGQDAIVLRTTNISNGQSNWQVQTRQLTPAQQSSVQRAISQNLHVPSGAINVKSMGQAGGARSPRRRRKRSSPSSL